MSTTLAEICNRHASTDGEHHTSIEGLRLFRRSCPKEQSCGVQRPALGVVAQGSKMVAIGDQQVHYGPDQYLLISVELPATSFSTGASHDLPYLGMGLELEPTDIWEVMVASKIRDVSKGMPAPGLRISTMESGLRDAVLRLVRLLDSPQDQPVLVPLIKREIIYHLLRGPQSAALQRLATGDSDSCVLEAIRILRTRFNETVRMEALASDLGVSLSGLHHQFKAVTSMSPLQYQKHLRLQEARRRLLSRDGDAGSIAFAVGYNSPSQFSREYKRLFGESPSRDLERLRAAANA